MEIGSIVCNIFSDKENKRYIVFLRTACTTQVNNTGMVIKVRVLNRSSRKSITIKLKAIFLRDKTKNILARACRSVLVDRKISYCAHIYGKFVLLFKKCFRLFCFHHVYSYLIIPYMLKTR